VILSLLSSESECADPCEFTFRGETARGIPRSLRSFLLAKTAFLTFDLTISIVQQVGPICKNGPGNEERYASNICSTHSDTFANGIWYIEVSPDALNQRARSSRINSYSKSNKMV
jgi:hypothetical protein